MIKTYHKNGDFPTASYRALREDYGLHNRLIMQAIGKIVKKFEETGVVTHIERPVHYRFARSAENIAIGSENVAEDTNVSIPRRSQELGLSYGTLWSILNLDPFKDSHPHKVQLMQQLKQFFEQNFLQR